MRNRVEGFDDDMVLLIGGGEHVCNATADVDLENIMGRGKSSRA
jgi:hypothetical protein